MTAAEVEADSVRLLACGKPACSVEGCDEHAAIRGMCGPHDYRVLRYGDPHWQAPPREKKVYQRKGPPPPRTCVVGDCDGPTFGKHLCQAHFVAEFLDNIPAGCFSR